MSLMIKRFNKKLGDVDSAWHTMILPNQLPSEITQKINKENYTLEDFVVFVIISSNDWFAIHIKGVYIFKNNSLSFVSYCEILDSEINYNLTGTISSIKNECDILKIKTINNEYILKCDKEGAVYKIKRLIEFGKSSDGC